jgi:hypothetical protein
MFWGNRVVDIPTEHEIKCAASAAMKGKNYETINLRTSWRRRDRRWNRIICQPAENPGCSFGPSPD